MGDMNMETLIESPNQSSIQMEACEDENLPNSIPEDELPASNESETPTEIQQESISEVLSEDILEIKSKQSSRLPLARIKQIMKFDPDCSLISRDAIMLVSKATELFIEYLGKEAVKHTLNNKKKTVSKKDVDAAIDCDPNLCFLDGALDWE
ncbi:DNA polymerase epsilon subunit 4 [Harmonia axyridis]|uniref:DNA polymerase epsilon subunit 4 n=1 Tax=Harmonia axyridis TaxID=115357 RepID=UPI001E275380|nr:DNA polymerase epsilon subunit 4 [Harmonia axyridis]